MLEALKQRLGSVKLGDGQAYRNIIMFPILETTPSSTLDYLTLSEALESRLLTVSELTAGGSVPELKVVNESEKVILLLDGEELAGAKQNRVLNTSVLVPGKQTIVIPVSCTEQGRWNYTSNVFSDSGSVMSSSARARKNRSVSCSLKESGDYRSDQGEVWASVQELHDAAKVSSPTMAMRDVYEAKKDKIEDALNTFTMSDGQVGLFAVINGKISGMDIISSASAFKHLHPKLVKSYVIDAEIGKESKAKPQMSRIIENATHFIEDLPKCEEVKFKSVGLGEDFRYKTDNIVGSALVIESTVIHTAFFMIEAKSRTGRIQGFNRRREYRVY